MSTKRKWNLHAVGKAIDPTLVCKRYIVDRYLGGGMGMFETFWTKKRAIKYAKSVGAPRVEDEFTNTVVWESEEYKKGEYEWHD